MAVNSNRQPFTEYANCGIYSITFENGKRYIGQSIDIAARWKYHERASKDSVYPVYAAMRKHKYTFEILCNCTEDELDHLERDLISRLGTMSPHGYNLREGGANGRLGQEAREKISKAHRGRIWSDEHRKNMSDAQKGRSIPDERRKKISETLMGRKTGPLSDEHRAKLREKAKGRPKSEEHRRKLSEVNIGKKRGPHTDVTKEKIGKAHRGRKQGPLSPEQKARQMAGVRRYQEELAARKKSQEMTHGC